MQPTFKAAMSMADITPKKTEYLQGYEEECELSRCTPQRHTTDLKARILLISDGKDILVFLNFEMIFSDPCFEELTISVAAQDEIAAICHTDREHLVFSNTHNHQSYMTLCASEEKNVVQAVKEAYDRMRYVKMGIGSVCTAFGCSRGGKYTLDKTVPYDSLMNVLRIDDAETDQPIGMIYSVPMHNTVFGNGPGLKAVHNLLSCEFTGCASRTLEKNAQDPNFVAMHINGFYGNTTGCVGDRYYSQSVEELWQMGGAFAAEIQSVYNNISTHPMLGEIKTSLIKTTLHVRNHSDMSKEQWGDTDTLPCYLKMASFADCAFIGVNSEPFSIIGARLKAEAPFTLVMPAGNVGGWKGYIPTADTFDSTEYQAECVGYKSPYGKSTENEFYEKLINGLCELAEVSICRTYPALTIKNQNTACFEFASTVAAKKLVISFGERSRCDCAEDFSLCLYQGEKLVKTEQIQNNSVNYRAVNVENIEFDRAELTATKYWLNGISDAKAQIWAVGFVQN